MCLMLKQLKLSIGELRYLSLKCATCQAEITLDLTSENKPLNKRRSTQNLTPFECPACDTPFDTQIQKGIDQFRESYHFLSSPQVAKTQISFTISVPENI